MTNEALAHANTSASTSQRGDARRSNQLDSSRVGRVSRMGTVVEGLRTAAPEEKVSTGSGSDRVAEGADGKKRNDRRDADYSIDALAKGLKVLEALEGRSFEPVTIERVRQRTGFSRDYCMRALKTLKVAGWAKQTFDGWVLGPKAENLSGRLTAMRLSDPQIADRQT